MATKKMKDNPHFGWPLITYTSQTSTFKLSNVNLCGPQLLSGSLDETILNPIQWSKSSMELEVAITWPTYFLERVNHRIQACLSFLPHKSPKLHRSSQLVRVTIRSLRNVITSYSKSTLSTSEMSINCSDTTEQQMTLLGEISHPH